MHQHRWNVVGLGVLHVTSKKVGIIGTGYKCSLLPILSAYQDFSLAQTLAQTGFFLSVAFSSFCRARAGRD